MSIVLEWCPNCHGSGTETCWYVQGHGVPFRASVPHEEPCWTCDGEGKVAVMLSTTELGDLIAPEAA